MKTRLKGIILVMGAGALISGGLAQSSATATRLFIRPSYWDVTYTDHSFRMEDGPTLQGHSKQTGSVAVGVMFGPRQNEEVSLECTSLPWNLRSSGGYWIDSDTIASGHFMPVLANYRYYWGDATRPLRVYAGVSVGAAKIRGSLSSSWLTGTFDSWSPVYGGVAGVSWQVQPDVFLELGYRYLRIRGTDLDTLTYLNGRWHSALTFHFDDAVANVLTCSLTVPLTAGYRPQGKPAPTRFFIRPAFWCVTYASPSFQGNQGSTGPTVFHPAWTDSLAAGITLGTRPAHELSLEWAPVPWRYEETFGSLDPSQPPQAGDPTFGTAAKGRYMVFLANYRCYSGEVARKLRVYAAISAGTTRVTGDYLMELSGFYLKGTLNNWSPTYSGAVGVSWQMLPNVHWELGYRYLRIQGSNLQTSDAAYQRNPLRFGDTVAQVLTCGLTFRL